MKSRIPYYRSHICYGRHVKICLTSWVLFQSKIRAHLASNLHFQASLWFFVTSQKVLDRLYQLSFWYNGCIECTNVQIVRWAWAMF